MKKYLSIIVIVFITFPIFAFATESAKLPYAAGERFIVSTGYNTPPTHIKKDSYAIDFTQNDCDAYGKYAIAAMAGTVTFVSESGYNGGYGTEVLVRDARNVTERYAHMIPGSVPIKEGDAIPQGTIIGEIGNTGLVAGAACVAHPGTHIHFAMYTENADGTFAAYDPEPMSGYTNIKAENWYASDNVLAATKGNLASLIGILDGLLESVTTVVVPSDSTIATSSVAKGTVVGVRTTATPSVSSTSVPVTSPAVSSSISKNISTTLEIRLPSTTTTTNNSVATSSTTQLSSGGGGGSISVVTPIIATTLLQTPTTSTESSSDEDISDDSVETCNN